MLARKRQTSWVNVLAMAVLLLLSFSSSTPALAGPVEPGSALAPGAFQKISPASGLVLITPTLTWSASAGATQYDYCVDTSNNDQCDTAWVKVTTGRTVTPPILADGVTYYWQVRATDASTTYVYANGSAWWNFSGILPGDFNKLTPPSVSDLYDPPITLTWSASVNATSYKYCIDTSNNDFCGTGWVDVGLDRQVTPPNLADDTTYYWHVVAFTGFGYVESNTGDWWSFHASPPAAFKKQGPANGAGMDTTSPTLSWQAAAGADRYSTCVDTVNDNQCNTTWVNQGARLAVTLSGLADRQTYYWQARATGDYGDTDANSGTWFSFRTDTIPLYLPFTILGAK